MRGADVSGEGEICLGGVCSGDDGGWKVEARLGRWGGWLGGGHREKVRGCKVGIIVLGTSRGSLCGGFGEPDVRFWEDWDVNDEGRIVECADARASPNTKY